MSTLIGFMDSMRRWSVERKMILMLLVVIVAIPLSSLVLLQSQGVETTTNFLVVTLTFSIVLLVPFAKWMSHIIALRFIKELNTQCVLLKNGDYAKVDLPPGEDESHDFTTLQRNMHWMGYTIATRERRLQSAMTDLAVAQRQIGESLDYASLIQHSFLPDRQALSSFLSDHFLIWSQRDVVGGDSYWFKPWGNGFFIGVIDCTGHGVPGAFMTLIVQSLLERAVVDCSGSPAEILGRMNRLIKDALGQKEKGAMSDDGMDCTLCHVDLNAGRLIFAGANTPIYIVDEGGSRMIKGDRCGIGYVRSPWDYAFTDVTIALEPGMRIYMATDGLVDQVGGEKGFPFGKRRFMEFMASVSKMPLARQEEELMQEFSRYQGDQSRRDDMTVLGFEIR